MPLVGVSLVGTAPVSFEEASVLSRSILWDAAEGDVEPVRVGDCTEASLIGDESEAGVETKALSVPVTASEIARRPMRGFEIDLAGTTADLGEPFEAAPLLASVDEVISFVLNFLLSYSSFVTVGEVRLVVGGVFVTASLADELRKCPIKVLF